MYAGSKRDIEYRPRFNFRIRGTAGLYLVLQQLKPLLPMVPRKLHGALPDGSLIRLEHSILILPRGIGTKHGVLRAMCGDEVRCVIQDPRCGCTMYITVLAATEACMNTSSKMQAWTADKQHNRCPFIPFTFFLLSIPHHTAGEYPWNSARALGLCAQCMLYALGGGEIPPLLSFAIRVSRLPSIIYLWLSHAPAQRSALNP